MVMIYTKPLTVFSFRFSADIAPTILGLMHPIIVFQGDSVQIFKLSRSLRFLVLLNAHFTLVENTFSSSFVLIEISKPLNFQAFTASFSAF